MWRLPIVMLSLLTACGGGGAAPADAFTTGDARPDAGIDAGFDAMPDAPPEPTLELEVDASQGRITDWRFPTTASGQRSAVALIVRNRGTVALDALAASLIGADASDFTIVGEGSTCGARTLLPGVPCVVRLAFAPTANGVRAATLRLATAGGRFDVPLEGEAVAPRPGLIADAVSVDFGPLELALHTDANVQLANTSATDVALGPRATTGDFAIVVDDCPATLAPGSTCHVTVRFTAAQAGWATGAVDVASSAGGVQVALAGLGMRRVTVVVQGKGKGVVTSTPSGLDCGATCSALFFDDVTLAAAVAGPAYGFGGWSEPCTMSPICTLPRGGGSVTLDAQFDVLAPAVAVTFAGQGRGYVLVVDAMAQFVLATCTGSCTTDVFPGTAITLYALTPSTFAGWDGACTGSSRVCDLGAVDDLPSITATFDRDEREVATLLPAATVTGLAMAPDGDVLIGDATGVTKVSPAGAIAWTTPIAGGAHDLATDSAGEVFGRTGAALFALAPGGAPTWSRSLAVTGSASLESAVAVSPDGTVIAALTSDGARVVDGTGVDRFTITGLAAEGVAVAPDGTIAIAIPSVAVPGGASAVARYSVTGATLPVLDPLHGGYAVSIAYDGQSYLLAATSGFGGAAVSRYAPDLGEVFTHYESVGIPDDLPAGVGADGAGDVLYLRRGPGGGVPGLELEVFPPDGSSTWIHAEPAAMEEGLTPSALAGGTDRRFAVAGTCEGVLPGIHLPWIQIFANP